MESTGSRLRVWTCLQGAVLFSELRAACNKCRPPSSSAPFLGSQEGGTSPAGERVEAKKWLGLQVKTHSLIKPRSGGRRSGGKLSVRSADVLRTGYPLEGRQEVSIDGHRLEFTNLTKVLYPKTGFTKGQLLDYYLRVAPVLLPHLKGRPVTMKRFPDGVDQFSFYEKHCPTHRPQWVSTTVVKGTDTPEGVRFCMINDAASLAWTAQLANIELHTTLARAPEMDRPTSMVFDLDPGEPAGVLECAQTALWLREKLEHEGLESFAKTSGSKGLQLHVPLNRSAGYEVVKPFAHELAKALEAEHGGHVVSKMSKALRKGKVFIDWSQNNRHKTTICVYSMRGRERPSVSTPVKWEELESLLRAGNAKSLLFGPEETLRRVDKYGDLFSPVLKIRQSLPRTVSYAT